jgi:acyl carrier protein
MTRDEALLRIGPILNKLAVEAGAPRGTAIQLESSLVDDLCFQSLTFIDLTISLEEEFGLAEFPMQRWADQQLPKSGRRFEVSSLVDVCTQLVNDGRFDPETTQ